MDGEGEMTTLGKSIIVPSVQELAKDCSTEIPERYIRDDQDPPILSEDDDLRVPVIDMEALVNGDGVELEKLHSACQEWGFFQIINHGVSLSLIDKVRVETLQFFNIPMHEKKKYWQTPTDVEGFGQAFVVSDEQKLDWADMFYMTTLPKHLRRPYLFPMLPLPYRETLESYTEETHKLIRRILDYMAKALNIDSDLKGDVFGGGNQAIRVNYYPPCPQPDKVIGLTPHTDAISLITILLRLHGMEGLEIKRNNEWVAIKPDPYAFVVNVGDMLEIMSNGIYRSVMHRAVVSATKERLSLATFHGTAIDGEIGPIPDLINSTNPPKFQRMSTLEYWKRFLAHPLNGNTHLDVIKIVEN